MENNTVSAILPHITSSIHSFMTTILVIGFLLLLIECSVVDPYEILVKHTHSRLCNLMILKSDSMKIIALILETHLNSDIVEDDLS